MELKQIKELMAAMGRTGTKKLVLKKDDFELEIERNDHGDFRTSEIPHDFTDVSAQKLDAALRRASSTLPRSEENSSIGPQDSKKEDPNSLHIVSPMVGTYYSSASPGDAPFVKVGDRVEKNTVVCIIEAMKVMNEVKAGVAGTIMEILVENGHPVEFGSKLFRIVS